MARRRRQLRPVNIPADGQIDIAIAAAPPPLPMADCFDEKPVRPFAARRSVARRVGRRQRQVERWPVPVGLLGRRWWGGGEGVGGGGGGDFG